jgi:hypothetical protein
MKTISQIIAGAQVLLNISYDLAGCFEEYLSDKYKTFLYMLRVIRKSGLIPRSIYVKGYRKVSFVLMTAVICLAALKYLRLFTPVSDDTTPEDSVTGTAQDCTAVETEIPDFSRTGFTLQGINRPGFLPECRRSGRSCSSK